MHEPPPPGVFWLSTCQSDVPGLSREVTGGCEPILRKPANRNLTLVNTRHSSTLWHHLLGWFNKSEVLPSLSMRLSAKINRTLSTGTGFSNLFAFNWVVLLELIT